MILIRVIIINDDNDEDTHEDYSKTLIMMLIWSEMVTLIMIMT